jgi:hypothetical protein
MSKRKCGKKHRRVLLTLLFRVDQVWSLAMALSNIEDLKGKSKS